MPEHVPIKSYVFFDCETTGLTGKRLKLNLKIPFVCSIIYYNLQNLFLKSRFWSFHLIPMFIGTPSPFLCSLCSVVQCTQKHYYYLAPRITEISFVAVHLAELELYCKHLQTLVQAQVI